MQHIKELTAFIAVVQTGSFTKAAARLHLSQSALSHSIRKLETQLNLKLLNRTTRSLATTEAGERLYQMVAPRLAEIEQELSLLQDQQGKIAGLVRITATEHPLNWFIWQRIVPLLQAHPELCVELHSETRFTDIVKERFDIGIRFGSDVAQDMIAVRLTPDIKMVVAGSPSYFAQHGVPQSPQDLANHFAINVRLPTHGKIMEWEFWQQGQKVQLIPPSRMLANYLNGLREAALAGLGLIWVTEDSVAEEVAQGKLLTVLDDYAITLDGYHLYYSNRKNSAALRAVIDALRWKENG